MLFALEGTRGRHSNWYTQYFRVDPSCHHATRSPVGGTEEAKKREGDGRKRHRQHLHARAAHDG